MSPETFFVIDFQNQKGTEAIEDLETRDGTVNEYGTEMALLTPPILSTHRRRFTPAESTSRWFLSLPPETPS